MGNLFGARYYDARTSVWQSTDPAIEKIFPTGDKDKDAKLPGMGGVYNSRNMAMYTYSHQNPVKLSDPDGNSPVAEIVGKEVVKQLARTAPGWVGAAVEPTPVGEGVMAVVSVAATIYGVVNAISAINNESKTQKQDDFDIVERAMSVAELKAIEKTGLLRGGEIGPTYATVPGGVPKTKKGAKSLLALPKTPEISVTVKVPKGFFGAPTPVEPANDEPGGGVERMSVPPVPVIDIIKIRPLED